MDKRVIKQIQLLKSIQPSREWSVQTRDVLFSQIRAQGKVGVQKSSKIACTWAYARSTFSTAYQYSIGLLFERPLALASALSVFVISVLGAFFYSQTSMPGDALYAMKRTSEGVRTALVSPDDRAQLEIEFADRRMEEIRAVSEKKETAPEEKAKSISGLLDNASENFTNVKKTLEDAKSVSTPKKIVDIAKLAQAKAGQYEKALGQVQSADPDRQNAVLAQKINTALTDVHAAESKALEVIVDKKDIAQMSDDEVKSQIAQYITQTQEKVEKVKVTAAGLTDETAKAKTASAADSAQKALEEAKAVLEKNEYKSAVAKLDESKKIIDSLQAQSASGDPAQEKIKLIY
ncbi:hypothetical protein HYW94_03245 [Candidatus Uhrbacteria bacterium]|nr:hypothetical protein [Candidatus Uhrbacteria bacterium]